MSLLWRRELCHCICVQLRKLPSQSSCNVWIVHWTSCVPSSEGNKNEQVFILQAIWDQLWARLAVNCADGDPGFILVCFGWSSGKISQRFTMSETTEQVLDVIFLISFQHRTILRCLGLAERCHLIFRQCTPHNTKLSTRATIFNIELQAPFYERRKKIIGVWQNFVDCFIESSIMQLV